MKLLMFSSIKHRPCTSSSISSCLQRILNTAIPATATATATAAAVSAIYLSSSSSSLFVQSFQPSTCFLQSHQKYRLQPMTTTTTTITIATPSTTSTTTALSLSTTTPSSVLPQFKKQYLLQYTYVKDVLEKRGPFREEHLAIANELVQDGTCISGGPTADITINESYCSISQIPTGALFIFTSIDAAQLFISRDPYVSNGIVTNYTINEWTIVVS